MLKLDKYCVLVSLLERLIFRESVYETNVMKGALVCGGDWGIF